MEIQSDIGQPIVFKTTTEPVYRSTLQAGESWLRSDEYYRQLEDQVRGDSLESSSPGRTTVPLSVSNPGGASLHFSGEGFLAERLPAHYIMSFHGTSIAEAERRGFGGYTFGVKNIMLLASAVLLKCSTQIGCFGYNWNQINYQFSGLQISDQIDGAPIVFGDNPPRCFRTLAPNAFRKRPVQPFIDQDEWRIVIWTNGYLNSDPMLPLRIIVPAPHFYPYIEGQPST
jgi:hypothetical protein